MKSNMEGITEKQQFVLDYLKDVDDYVSPTTIGKLYGKRFLNRDDCHSSTGSPILKKLVTLGLVDRNYRGWYKLKISAK